jgi:hypothetical protein
MDMRQWRLFGSAAMWIVVLAAGLTGCGGGGGEAAPPPAASPAPILNTDGGVVSGTAGVTVLVPPGALAEPATIRVAVDSTGAPPIPAWFSAAGPMVAITPHGATFAEPVTVRLPAPNVTLAANERLLIAKAQPGGEWEVFADTELKDGQLEVKVRSFSVFMVARVQMIGTIIPGAPPVPFDVGPVTIVCDGQACASPELLRPMTLTVRASGNGGQMPANCVNPQFQFRDARGTNLGQPVPASASGLFQQSFPLRTDDKSFFGVGPDAHNTVLTVVPFLVCVDAASNASSAIRLGHLANLTFNPFRRDPGTPIVVKFPANLSQAPGDIATVNAILTSGASPINPLGGANQGVIFIAPSDSNQAFVYLERLAFNDSAWRIIDSRGQMQANSSPTGTVAWMYWGFDFRIGPLTLNDSGASYRIRACYQHPSRGARSAPSPPSPWCSRRNCRPSRRSHVLR